MEKKIQGGKEFVWDISAYINGSEDTKDYQVSAYIAMKTKKEGFGLTYQVSILEI